MQTNASGHPTRLFGRIDEIVDDAKRIAAALPRVHGLDLLAYRFAGDAKQLAAPGRAVGERSGFLREPVPQQMENILQLEGVIA